MLARTLLNSLNRKQKRGLRGFSKDALVAMEAYSWPGNVRDLENKIKRAIMMCEVTQITTRDLELEETVQYSAPLNLRYAREAAERQALLKAMSYTGGNLSQAADLLGITRPTLYTLLNKYQMKF